MQQGTKTSSSGQGASQSAAVTNGGGPAAPRTSAARYPTDEEILGIGTDSGVQGGREARGGIDGGEEILRPDGTGTQDDRGEKAWDGKTKRDEGAASSAPTAGQGAEDDSRRGTSADREMLRSGAPEAQQDNLEQRAAPEWLRPLLADPKSGSEVRTLWEQHQAYREIFPTVAEARTLKGLFPGSAEDAKEILARAEAVSEVDDAYFSADPSVQAQLAANLFQQNPHAFQAMLGQAVQVLAERDPESFRELADQVRRWSDRPAEARSAPLPRDAQQTEVARERAQLARQREEFERQRQDFRASQYAAFQQSANESVVQQVRQAIEQMVSGILPGDVADGARKRIAEDIFGEINATLQTDRGLTRQVAGILRQWKFDDATRQQVVNLIFGRTRTLLPAVAKRVVSDWTTSVLSANRQKTAKQQAAAGRVDIVGGGAPESIDKRPLSPRDIDYRKTTDDEILGL